MTNGEKLISDFPHIEVRGQDEVFTTIQIDTTGTGGKMKLENAIALIEDYLEWGEKYGDGGSGVDDATKTLLEVAKKYEEIKAIVDYPHYSLERKYVDIRRVIHEEDKD